ncbi:MAG: hypothetical protein RR415_13315 [Ruthenibacterium sp.]
MRNRPLRVYLDSSDYSVLSNSRKMTSEHEGIRARLLEYSRSGDVEFRYSAAHICEMAPVAPEATENAVARTQFMVELCGSRCFRSLPDIIQEEKKVFLKGLGGIACTTSDAGDWFPPIEAVFEPLRIRQGGHLERRFQTEVEGWGCNRKQRRLVARRCIKNGVFRHGIEQSLLEGAKNNIQEILRSYPMQENHALTLWRFVMGKATETQAKNAFLASLRDPVWMTRWFINHFDQMSPVGRWFREPSEKVYRAVSEARDAAQHVRRQYEAAGLDFTKISGIDDVRTVENLEKFLLEMFTTFGFTSPNGEGLNIDSLKSLRQAAPGLSTMLEVAVAIGFSSMRPSPRNPLESDFVDVAHAIYAPYVDIFRADSFMAPIVKRALNLTGTRVEGKLRGVIPAIETGLVAQQFSQQQN